MCKIQYPKEVQEALEKIKAAEANRKELREELSKQECLVNEARDLWRKSIITIADLKENLLPPLLSEFNIGDKVLVRNEKKEPSLFGAWYDAEGFVSKVKVIIRIKGDVEFEYSVNAINKNGTQSKKALHSVNHEYDVSQLEMIKKA
jgi:hypothetical protein|tara:strand:- start:1072 stop:1512 length:441 start_codon:yes stop_codon:yes gene_type:complete